MLSVTRGTENAGIKKTKPRWGVTRFAGLINLEHEMKIKLRFGEVLQVFCNFSQLKELAHLSYFWPNSIIC